jgi:hypothetical protein
MTPGITFYRVLASELERDLDRALDGILASLVRKPEAVGPRISTRNRLAVELTARRSYNLPVLPPVDETYIGRRN